MGHSFSMKRYQSILTILVILQVAMVVLLGAMTIFSYQSQTEVQQLRNDLVEIQKASAVEAESPVVERLSEIEARLGMRDSEADQATVALQQQMAQANVLKQRFNDLRGGAALGAFGAPPTSGPPSISPPPPATIPKQMPPSPIVDGLTPTEQAISQLPVVAEIVTFDSDWQFYTINKGELDGIRADQEFAVRNKNGFELLANVKISGLHPQDAIVEIIKATAKAGAPSPAAGDVLIDTSKLR
ncbi:MAG: hypothetical protein ACI8T1_004135 [Verrucomicrobiales bacterium]|jgi:hypothetical protein